jgi:DNA-directed RNA polymerase subunit RPC12/RpoP
MPSTPPPLVVWRCPKCKTENYDHIDAEPIPYHCAECGESLTLKELTRLKAA